MIARLDMRTSKHCIAFCFALLCMRCAVGQELPSLSVRGNSMGGAGVALQDAASALSHGSALAFLDKASLLLAVQNHYLLRELSTEMVGLVLPCSAIASTLHNGTFALQFHRQGTATFAQQKVSAAYAIRLSPRMALGTTFLYNHNGGNDAHYTNYRYLSLSVAGQWWISKNCLVGVVLSNPFSIVLTTTDKEMAPSCRWNMGATYRPLPDLLVTLELEQSVGCKPRLLSGMEYQAGKGLYLRVGCSTLPWSYAFGAGCRRARWGLDIATQRHHVLGLSPQLACYLIL